MLLAFNYSLIIAYCHETGHAENINTNYAIISQTSCLRFIFSLKTYFFKLLDHWSDFHQIRHQKVMDFVSIDKMVFV